jgi:hypothetical protein
VSWWIGLDRQEFQRRLPQETERMRNTPLDEGVKAILDGQAWLEEMEGKGLPTTRQAVTPLSTLSALTTSAGTPAGDDE